MSLYKRGNKYYMDFVIKGQRVNKSTGTSDKRKAQRIEIEAKMELEKELSVPPEERLVKLTLSQAFKRCYEERWQYNKDGERGYNRTKKIVAYLDDKAIPEITNSDITTLIEKLKEEGLTNGTINRHLTYLRTTLNMAFHKWGALKRLPYIQLLKEPPGRVTVISEKEEERIVSHFRDTLKRDDLADLTIVLIDTGMRRGEVLKLEYKDIDFNNDLIFCTINKEGDRPKAVPMTSRVREILLRRKEENEVKPFTLTGSAVSQAWRRMRNRLGYKKEDELVPHALRHTCASRLVQNGVDLYTVKEWLGHSTIQVTEKYAHLQPEKLKQAAKVLEKRKIPAECVGKTVGTY